MKLYNINMNPHTNIRLQNVREIPVIFFTFIFNYWEFIFNHLILIFVVFVGLKNKISNFKVSNPWIKMSTRTNITLRIHQIDTNENKQNHGNIQIQQSPTYMYKVTPAKGHLSYEVRFHICHSHQKPPTYQARFQMQ